MIGRAARLSTKSHKASRWFYALCHIDTRLKIRVWGYMPMTWREVVGMPCPPAGAAEEAPSPASTRCGSSSAGVNTASAQGLTLVHFSAELELVYPTV